jgi:hypothetical protein
VSDCDGESQEEDQRQSTGAVLGAHGKPSFATIHSSHLSVLNFVFASQSELL